MIEREKRFIKCRNFFLFLFRNNETPTRLKSPLFTFQISVQQIRGELHADDRGFSQETLQNQRRGSPA